MDGAVKRDKGEKPPWYIDPAHDAAVMSHLSKWKKGELVDPGLWLAHLLRYLLRGRLLAIACRGDRQRPRVSVSPFQEKGSSMVIWIWTKNRGESFCLEPLIWRLAWALCTGKKPIYRCPVVVQSMPVSSVPREDELTRLSPSGRSGRNAQGWVVRRGTCPLVSSRYRDGGCSARCVPLRVYDPQTLRAYRLSC